MPSSDDDILVEAQRWVDSGRAVAVATVIETWGSAPRPAGAHLIVNAEGNFIGSVSGGCVEGEVIAQALDSIANGGSRALEFGVADEMAWKVGLSCGGRIKVDVRLFDPRILAALNAERAARRPCAIVTHLGSGAQRFIGAADLAADVLATPLAARLRRRESGVEETSEGAIFIAVYPPPVRIIAIGAVHISQALAPMATVAGFEIIVVDPRTAFATAERFQGARLVPEWPKHALEELGLDRDTAIVLLTHEPRIDDEALIAALREECFYIGALGSRKTHAKRIERMRAEGFGEAELRRIHAPVGLDIGARGPAEIAVSILAEIIGAVRYGASPSPIGRA